MVGVFVKTLHQNSLSARSAAVLRCALLLVLGCAVFAQTALAKAVGTVKSISGNAIVLTTESGSEVTVTITESTRLVQMAPGQSDIKNAAAIQVSDIHVGDRVLALGPNGEGYSIAASTLIVMKQSDIAQKRQQEREEWRKGTGGIVKEVSPAAGTITIANALASSGKPIVIRVSTATSIRRYPPDSVNFDDAKPSTMNEIKLGDQLRARGTKNDDGSEFTAQAIVTGAFRNIAGTVISTDVPNSSITVMDLSTKHPVMFKIGTDSHMHKLPPTVAQRLAARLKGGAAGANGNPQAGESSQSGTGSSNRGEGQNGQRSWRGRSGSGDTPDSSQAAYRRGNGAPDFQQMLSRMPTVAISDLLKGDAVMLVATEGSATAAPTAIMLISGVEPILTAAPGSAAAANILSPWNLGSSPGGGEGTIE
jgi:hypothetical protein